MYTHSIVCIHPSHYRRACLPHNTREGGEGRGGEENQASKPPTVPASGAVGTWPLCSGQAGKVVDAGDSGVPLRVWLAAQKLTHTEIPGPPLPSVAPAQISLPGYTTGTYTVDWNERLTGEGERK